MGYDRKLCSICAWRKDCKKKFSLGDNIVNCPDFSEDLKLKKELENKDERKN